MTPALHHRLWRRYRVDANVADTTALRWDARDYRDAAGHCAACSVRRETPQIVNVAMQRFGEVCETCDLLAHRDKPYLNRLEALRGLHVRYPVSLLPTQRGFSQRGLDARPGLFSIRRHDRSPLIVRLSNGWTLRVRRVVRSARRFWGQR